MRHAKPGPRIRIKFQSRRESARDNIRRYEQDYQRTQNPVFVWSAYVTARRARLRVPSWVMEYLDRVVTHLRVMAQPGRQPKKGEIARTVARALEITDGRQGARNAFTILSDLADEVGLAAAVFAEMNVMTARKQQAAFLLVAEQRGVSVATVRRAFEAHRADLEADPTTKSLLPYPDPRSRQ